MPEPPAKPHLTGDDLLGAAGVFGLVFFSTLPVVLPFVFISGPSLALRVSNLVAIGMLFLTGYIFGRSTGHRQLLVGCTMVLVGALLTSRLPSEDKRRRACLSRRPALRESLRWRLEVSTDWWR